MDVLGDLVARSRRSPAPALRAVATGRTTDYRRFCTTTWKVGNLLRHHLGVRGGSEVAIAPVAAPEAVFSLFGAALLGAPVRFSRDPGGARAVVCPAGAVPEVAPATKVLAYGERPTDPAVAFFERDVWSENPTEPPDRVEPGAVALVADGVEYTHADLLVAADRAATEWGLTDAESVALAAPLTDPGTVVALLAALLVGGEVVLGDEGDVVVEDPTGLRP
jgi:hypothetical protein